jgi:hypothetical protein
MTEPLVVSFLCLVLHIHGVIHGVGIIIKYAFLERPPVLFGVNFVCG